MLGNYILNDRGEPEHAPDLLTWARWFEDSAARRHNFDRDDARPVLWETMVFGGPLDQEQVRYRSREEALGGHMLLVEQLRALPFAPEEKR